MPPDTVSGRKGPKTSIQLDNSRQIGPRTVGPEKDVGAQLSVFQGEQLGVWRKNQDRIKNVELYTQGGNENTEMRKHSFCFCTLRVF